MREGGWKREGREGRRGRERAGERKEGEWGEKRGKGIYSDEKRGITTDAEEIFKYVRILLLFVRNFIDNEVHSR